MDNPKKLTVNDCLLITFGEFFECEDRGGNFCCVPKEQFVGLLADTSRGQSIDFKSGYVWRWHPEGIHHYSPNPLSGVHPTKEEALIEAFDNCWALCPKNERTEDISEWDDYARDNEILTRYLDEWRE